MQIYVKQMNVLSIKQMLQNELRHSLMQRLEINLMEHTVIKSHLSVGMMLK